MTKQDIVEQLASGIGISRPEVAAVVDGFLALVMDAVAQGDKVELRRFGTWKPTVRKARHLRIPDGSRIIDLPTRSTVVFSPAGEFKSRLAELKVPDGSA
ncbi:HU family DNA-binding protein [candidate division KSB1 bacterium]|nr:HU family DNA-binding protein [candidate division KSB1 bacterium]